MRVSDLEGSDGLRLKKKENGKKKKKNKERERDGERDREEMAEQKGDGREKE